MGNVLTPKKTTLAAEYEDHMFGGNRLWAKPDEAREVGRQILSQLAERYDFEDERNDSPALPDVASKIFKDVLSTINYAALPTERRSNILHGLIDAAAEAGILGGEPEWAPIEETEGVTV